MILKKNILYTFLTLFVRLVADLNLYRSLNFCFNYELKSNVDCRLGFDYDS